MNVEAETVTLLGLLDRLIEAPEPLPVSMVPQTWGWALLAFLLLSVCTLVAIRAWRRYRVNAYRRYALAELEAAGDDPVVIAAILRRTALVAYPRRDVAGLIGEEWLRFLDDQVSGDGFVKGPGRVVTVAPYRATRNEPMLHALAKNWIIRHRPEGTS